MRKSFIKCLIFQQILFLNKYNIYWIILERWGFQAPPFFLPNWESAVRFMITEGIKDEGGLPFIIFFARIRYAIIPNNEKYNTDPKFPLKFDKNWFHKFCKINRLRSLIIFSFFSVLKALPCKVHTTQTGIEFCCARYTKRGRGIIII